MTTRFSPAQLAYAAGLKGYLDRAASLEFLKTMDIRMSVGPLVGRRFLRSVCAAGLSLGRSGVQQRLRGRSAAAPRRPASTRSRFTRACSRRRSTATSTTRRIERAQKRLPRRARHDASPPATSTPGPTRSSGSADPCNPDPALRKAALDEVLKGVEICRLMKIPVLSVWPGSDGADYHFQIDYKQSIEWFTEALVAVNKECLEHGIKLAIEPKPYEPRELYMIIPTAASAILVAQQVNKACGGNNCGLTIDYGHQKMEATTASTSCDLAAYAGVPSTSSTSTTRARAATTRT